MVLALLERAILFSTFSSHSSGTNLPVAHIHVHRTSYTTQVNITCRNNTIAGYFRIRHWAYFIFFYCEEWGKCGPIGMHKGMKPSTIVGIFWLQSSADAAYGSGSSALLLDGWTDSTSACHHSIRQDHLHKHTDRKETKNWNEQTNTCVCGMTARLSGMHFRKVASQHTAKWLAHTCCVHSYYASATPALPALQERKTKKKM